MQDKGDSSSKNIVLALIGILGFFSLFKIFKSDPFEWEYVFLFITSLGLGTTLYSKDENKKTDDEKSSFLSDEPYESVAFQSHDARVLKRSRKALKSSAKASMQKSVEVYDIFDDYDDFNDYVIPLLVVNREYAMDYTDANGKQTKRHVVYLDTETNQRDQKLMSAYCKMQDDKRLFRYGRINSLVDTITGESLI